jgi:hypothetical protein
MASPTAARLEGLPILHPIPAIKLHHNIFAVLIYHVRIEAKHNEMSPDRAIAIQRSSAVA